MGGGEGEGRGKKIERNGLVEEKRKRHKPSFQNVQACPFLSVFPGVAE